MRLKFWTAIIVVSVGTCIYAQSQPPSPGAGKREGGEPNQQAGNTHGDPGQSTRGTDNSPVTVKLLPIPKTQDEAAQIQRERDEKTSAEWWTKALGVLTIFVMAGQLIVYWVQAKRLRQTIETMERIDKGQTEKMERSIEQATRSATEMGRSATAMEGIGVSLATSVTQLNETLALTQQMADATAKNLKLASTVTISIPAIKASLYDDGIELNVQILNGSIPAQIDRAVCSLSIREGQVIWTGQDFGEVFAPNSSQGVRFLVPIHKPDRPDIYAGKRAVAFKILVVTTSPLNESIGHTFKRMLQFTDFSYNIWMAPTSEQGGA